jgi:hypothetical protein
VVSLPKITVAKIILQSLAPVAVGVGAVYGIFWSIEYRTNRHPASQSCLELIKLEKDIGKFGVLIAKIAEDGKITQGECNDFRDTVLDEDRLETARKEKAAQEALIKSIVNDEPDMPQEDLDPEPQVPSRTRSPIKQPTKG